MSLVERWRSVNEEVRFFLLGVLSSATVAEGPSVYGSTVGTLRGGTQVLLVGIVATGAVSSWSMYRITNLGSQLEQHFHLLIRSHAHLARAVENIDGRGPPTTTDGGTRRGDTITTRTGSRGRFDTGAAVSGALVGSGSFALAAISVFGEFAGVWTLALLLVGGVGGVLGAYAGDQLTGRGRTTGGPDALPPVDAETIRAMVARSDLDRREVAEILAAADSGDESEGS